MSKQFLKKIILLVLVVIGTITLTACGNNDNPTGSISETDTYFQVGDHKITPFDLYQSFRLSAQSTLKEWFDETLVADQLTTVDSVIDKYTASSYVSGTTIDKESVDYEVVEWLETAAATALYGGTDYDTLEALSFNSKIIKANTFVDSLSILERDLDVTGYADTLVTLLDNWIAQGEVDPDDDWREFSLPKYVLKQYRLAAAQKLKARQLFADEDFDTDEESDYYISASDIVSYYKNNLKGRYDVEVFIVRFLNSNEADAMLRYFNLKSTSRGEWVKIPDPRVDLGSGNWKHVNDILSELGITPDTSDPDQKFISESDYKKYYDKYTISTSRAAADGERDIVLDADEVLDYFIQIEEALTNSTLTDDEKRVTYTYDDLSTDTSLRSHIYTTLTIPEDANSNDKQYSARVQSFSNYCYLVYKYADGAQDEKDIIVEKENEDGDMEEVFADTEKAQALRKEALDELKESKFTDTYVSTVVSELYEDKHPVIYDWKIKAFFQQNYADIELHNGGNGNNDTLAEFEGKTFKVDDMYNYLEAQAGVSAALDLAFTKLIRAKYEGDITTEDMDDFREQYKTVISNFSSDQLSGSGYPASMGRDKFLLIAFGATNNDEAMDNMYVIPKLKELFYADLEAHYGSGIYEKFAALAKLQYDNYSSTSTSHLLVYTDFDADGSPDDPNDLDATQRTDLETLIVELIRLVYDKIGNYYKDSGYSTAFNAIVAEYESVDRSVVAPNVGGLLDGTEGTGIWKKYRQAGLVLKYESLDAITNTTNTPAAQSYDQIYFDLALEMNTSLDEFRDKTASIPGSAGIFPYLIDYEGLQGVATGIDTELVNKVRSSFGWHFITVTALGYPSSAKYFEAEDDADDPAYISDETDVFGEKLNAYNNTDYISAAQIEIYIKETASEYGVQSLPSSVSTAISSFFTPIKTLYDTTYMQREILIKYVVDQNGGKFGNDNYGKYLNTLRSINKLQLFSYNSLSGLEGADEWNKLYSAWWDILNSATVLANNFVYRIGDDHPEYKDFVKVFDKDNNELDNSVDVDDSKVDYENAGIYNVEFEVTVDGTTISKTVTVRVHSELELEDDEEEPIFDFSDKDNIVVSAVTGDDAAYQAALDSLLAEVLSRITSVTDENGDGNLTSQVQVNMSFVNLRQKTISGGYIIILTVVDSHGNETVESLTVEVQ